MPWAARGAGVSTCVVPLMLACFNLEIIFVENILDACLDVYVSQTRGEITPTLIVRRERTTHYYGLVSYFDCFVALYNNECRAKANYFRFSSAREGYPWRSSDLCRLSSPSHSRRHTIVFVRSFEDPIKSTLRSERGKWTILRAARWELVRTC